MVGPNYSRPPVEEPPAFKSELPASPWALPETGWWELYADPELTQFDCGRERFEPRLFARRWRAFDQARALARVAGSYLYPSDLGESAFSRTRFWERATAPSPVSP